MAALASNKIHQQTGALALKDSNLRLLKQRIGTNVPPTRFPQGLPSAAGAATLSCSSTPRAAPIPSIELSMESQRRDGKEVRHKSLRSASGALSPDRYAQQETRKLVNPQPPQFARTEENSPVRRTALEHPPYLSHLPGETGHSDRVHRRSHSIINSSNMQSEASLDVSVASTCTVATQKEKVAAMEVQPQLSHQLPSAMNRNANSYNQSMIPSARGSRSCRFQDVDASRLEIGLENLGNTCFMNSVLQCLLHIDPLVSYFLGSRIEQELNASSSKKGVLATSFYQLVQEVFYGKSGNAVAPVNFHRAVAAFAPYLMDFQQQDSQEFLRFLLDGMSEDLCRRKSTSLSPTNQEATQENDGGPDSSVKGHKPRDGRANSTILPVLPPLQQSVASHSQQRLNSVGVDSLSASLNSPSQPQTLSRMPSVEKLKANGLGVRNADTGSHRANEDVEVAQPSCERSHTKVRAIAEVQASRSMQNTSAEGGTDTNGTETDDDQRVDSAPATSRSRTPSFSSQLRDVVSGRKFLFRRRAESDDATANRKEDGANQSGADGNSDSNNGDSGDGNNVDKEAAVAWERYLKLNDSIITDLFGGLLQSTITCLTCNSRSHTFDPFLDISVPISRDSDSTSSSSRGLFGSFRQAAVSSLHLDSNKSTLEKCLTKFTAEEILDGDNMFNCERCKKKRKASKQMLIYRYPKVLVIHIKRFRYNSTHREKLSTDVHFPLQGLDLRPYVRKAEPVSPPKKNNNSLENMENNHHNHSALTPNEHISNQEPMHRDFSTANIVTAEASVANQRRGSEDMGAPLPIYDLIGVSHHHGSLHGGHYIAHVDTNYCNVSKGQSSRWMCFNDARVSNAQASAVMGPTAYVLFYRLRENELENANDKAS